MNNRTKCFFAMVFIFFQLSSIAVAHGGGSHAGNGGGAWVCRESNQKIRWAELVDLFEAEHEFGLSIASYTGTYFEILDKVKKALVETSPTLALGLTEYFSNVHELKESPPAITYIDDDLEVITDSLYRIKPAKSRCVGGEIKYEQIVNYKQDGKILVQRELFSGKTNAGLPILTNTTKAALIFHEALYAYRRALYRDKDSVLTRQMIGLIFSTLTASEQKVAFLEMADSEFSITSRSFTRINPGTFLMGSPIGEIDRRNNETQHLMTIPYAFEVMKTRVTQSQWFEVMGDNPSMHNPDIYRPTAAFHACPKSFVDPIDNHGIALCLRNPVDTVSYDDVQRFLKKLNTLKNDGYIYRLPTEAEWEYVVRAGTQTTYFWTSNPYGVGHENYAWVGYDTMGGGPTHEVASLKANPWGIYDVVGELFEWVSDWYAADYERFLNGGPSNGTYRVYRGGFGLISSDRRSLRSASRFRALPSDNSRLGFRLVRVKATP